MFRFLSGLKWKAGLNGCGKGKEIILQKSNRLEMSEMKWGETYFQKKLWGNEAYGADYIK